MDKIVFIVSKKPIKSKQRSLDLALGYFENNSELQSNRWIAENGSSRRIGRTSYQKIVIPAIEDINSAISRYIPEFSAFKIVQTEWRRDKYHKSIQRNQAVRIEEDEEHFYIEVAIPDRCVDAKQ